MEVFPMVNNFDGKDWSGDVVGFLNNPGARAFSAGKLRSFFLPVATAD